MQKKNQKLTGDPAVDVQRVVRTRRPKNKCDHEAHAIYTRFCHERNQYEWLCSKCGDVIKTESLLDVYMRQPSPTTDLHAASERELKTPSRRHLQRVVRRIPIDFAAIARETGITRGKVCKSTWAGWCVQNHGDGPNLATIEPPPMLPGETEIRIRKGNWCFYAPNSEVSQPGTKI